MSYDTLSAFDEQLLLIIRRNRPMSVRKLASMVKATSPRTVSDQLERLHCSGFIERYGRHVGPSTKLPLLDVPGGLGLSGLFAGVDVVVRVVNGKQLVCRRQDEWYPWERLLEPGLVILAEVEVY